MKRIVLIVALAACRKETAAVPDSGAPVAVVAAVDAGFVLTAEMLDAYLRYVRAAVDAPAAGGDGGSQTFDRARRDEAALKASGLADADVTKIDEMVSTVIARRMVTALAGNPQFMPDMAAMGQALNAEQKKHMEEAMAAFKQQQQQAKELTEERKRYGSANIDVLLSREPELTKAWAEQMNVPPPMMMGH